MADLRQPARMGVPGQRRRLPLRRRGRRIGRLQRVLRQQVLQVGEDQLLVLLLMVEAEFQQRQHLRRLLRTGEPAAHGPVHPAPVVQHVGQGGPGQQATLGPRVPGPGRLVVGVEEVAVGGVDRRRPGVGHQQEGLEEPGGVRQVPLDRAGVRHALHRHVLCRQRFGQGQGAGAHALKAVEQRRGRRGDVDGVGHGSSAAVLPTKVGRTAAPVTPRVAPSRRCDGGSLDGKREWCRNPPRPEGLDWCWNPSPSQA